MVRMVHPAIHLSVHRFQCRVGKRLKDDVQIRRWMNIEVTQFERHFYLFVSTLVSFLNLYIAHNHNLFDIFLG